MEYKDSEFLQLSGLQHFAFCRRQWALIHIEGLWAENIRTVEGDLLHKRAHDETLREKRGDLLIVRSVRLRSAKLGVSGQCDVLEFIHDKPGVLLEGCDGKWLPYPVEYKRGESKNIDADRLQLCGQAMCLEEMLCCNVPEGALYYGQTRHRETVLFLPEMRKQVKNCLQEMHDFAERGYTPKVRPTKACNACSIKELCMPKLMKNNSAVEYFVSAIQEKI